MQKIISSCVVLLYLLFLMLSYCQAEQCELRMNGIQVYISDSHIGMGGQCQGQNCRDGWHNMEDFRWHEDFKMFLAEIDQIDKPVDLVVVGDFLELWQNMGDIPCADEQKSSDLGCNAKQAGLRVQQIGIKHKELFEIMSDFIKSDNNLIVIPGNHDAALIMRTVADNLKKHFTEKASTNVCVDEDGMVYTNGIFVEHGHQIEGDLNRYSEPQNGVIECLDSKGEVAECNESDVFVRRSWGENLVQNFFNDYENKFPVIDNYSHEGAGLPDGLKRGLKASSLQEKSAANLDFLSFLFIKQTLDQIISGLGDKGGITAVCNSSEDKAPCLNLDEMKTKLTTDKIFTQLPPESSKLLQIIFDVPGEALTLEDVYSHYKATDPATMSLINELLIVTCLYWDSLYENADQISCSYRNKSLGAGYYKFEQWVKGLTDSDYDHILKHIQQRERTLGKTVEYFIYGHTHKVTEEKTPDERKTILNTGAWQRVASADKFKDLIDKCVADNTSRDANDCFKSMTPNDLPACYSFVSNHNLAWKDKNTAPALYWWVSVQHSGDSADFRVEKSSVPPGICN